MRVLVLAVVAMLSTTVFAGCLTGGPQGSKEEIEKVSAWESQRDAHGAMGHSATFNLAGSPLYVLGPGNVRVTGPVDLAPAKIFPADKRFVFFPNATVDGFGAGLVVVEGEKIHLAAFPQSTFMRATAEASDVRIALESRVGGGEAGARFPVEWEDANRTYFFSETVDVGLAGIGVSGAARAVHLTATAARPLPAAFTLTTSTMRWESDGSVLVSPSATLDVERLSLGGDVRSGDVSPEGRAPIATPDGVWGKGAKVKLEPGRVQTLQPFRLTQALTTSGYALPSKVELLPSASEISVKKGETTYVRLHYRESTYSGDAVLSAIDVTGPGSALVKVPVRRPPLVIEQLWEVVNASGPTSPFVAIPILVASPGIIILDALLAFACFLTLCPEDYPYPQWMDAGEVGTFYVKVTGDATPGTYDSTVTIRGRNYEPVSFPLRVTVTA